MTYQDFIDTKRIRVLDSGIDINPSEGAILGRDEYRSAEGCQLAVWFR